MSVEHVAQTRGIDSLYHFTTIENLFSILERGFVYSRNNIDALKLEDDGLFTADYVDHMDDQRLDGLLDYVNLSLSRPNWYLLQKFMKRPELSHFDWCILKLDISPMFEPSTLFSVCNAASNAAKRYGVARGLSSFNALFQEEIVATSVFKRNNTPNNFTTDIQAEILVKDAISINHINKVFLANEAKMKQTESALRLLKLHVDKFEVNQPLFSGPILR